MGSKKFNLGAYLREQLTARGAMRGVLRELRLDTNAGILDISIYDEPDSPWVACIFDDVAKARQVVHNGSLNPHSGKWNWHCEKNEDHKEFADAVLRNIDQVLKSAPSFKSEAQRSTREQQAEIGYRTLLTHASLAGMEVNANKLEEVAINLLTSIKLLESDYNFDLDEILRVAKERHQEMVGGNPEEPDHIAPAMT